MNGYERINAALKGIMPDRRPVMLHNFMLAAKEAGYTMKQYREEPEAAADCHIRFVDKYGVDGILFDVDTALLADSVGVPVDFPENDPARAHKPLFTSLDDIDQLQGIDISGHIRIQHALETIKLLKKQFGGEVLVRGNCDQAPFALACAIRTPAEFMMDLMIDEERAMRLIDYCTEICIQFIRLMAEAGSDMISNGDSSAGPSMISPEMFAQFAYPSEKRLFDETKRLGLPYLMHICGNTDLILDQLAAMKFDAVELDYQTPIENIHRHFHDRSTLFGTIDPSGVITFGSAQEVENEAKKILNIYKGNPRLVIGAGCAIPPMAPEENIRAIIRAAKED